MKFDLNIENERMTYSLTDISKSIISRTRKSK